MKLMFLLLSLCAFNAFSQTTYFVKDSETEESLPFIKVFPNDQNPFIADIDGAIQISPSTTSIQLKNHGYYDTTILISSINDSIIYMQANVLNIEEMTVLPGENPAHRIMRQAIKNRKDNHPMKNDAFRYNSYSKFIFDINAEGMAELEKETSDTSLLKMKSFFADQHIFMLESASTRTFIPPYRDHEEITAYKISGFNDPQFSTFANGMQSFTFYDNQVDLLGSKYINPLAVGGLNRYLFILEDSTFQASDTTYTIYYRPRKGRSFLGMEGRLFINTNGYAVEKVIASPYEDTTGMQVKVIQEYEFIDDVKWFPTKLSTEVDLGTQLSTKIPNSSLIGSGQTYIEKIEINPSDLPKKFNNNIAISTAKDANQQNESEWDSLRRYQITEKELRTYEMVDSLSEQHKFENKLRILGQLLQGKVPLGPVSLDLTRLVSFNLYERYRFGMGLETSQKLMKSATIGGYFGWANGDKLWKYGGYSTIHLNKRLGMKIDLKYQQDLLERGGVTFGERSFSLDQSDSYRFLFISSMDHQRLGEIAFSADIKANMKLRLFGNYQRIDYTEDYLYSGQGADPFSSSVDVAETGIEFKWNILEKYMMLGDKKFSQGIKYPSIKLKIVRGWKDWFESDYEYVRVNSEISQTFKFVGFGEFQIKATGGKTFGSAPLFLMQQANGTGVDWLTSVQNSFETMVPASFFNSEQVALFTRFSFMTFRTKAKWNQPKIGLHHAIGFGRFDARADHSATFETMEKGYYEGGLIIDGLYTSGTTGLGLGVFYNYGSYASGDWKQNIVPKIALSFNLN